MSLDAFLHALAAVSDVHDVTGVERSARAEVIAELKRDLLQGSRRWRDHAGNPGVFAGHDGTFADDLMVWSADDICTVLDRYLADTMEQTDEQ
jgi:hypothetical protein